MLAAYLDDIPGALARMFGRGASTGGPRGYGMYFNNKGVLKSGIMGKLAKREIAAGSGLTSGLLFGRPMKGLSQATGHFEGSFGKLGIAGGMLFASAGAYLSPRGHKTSTMIGGIARTAAFGLGDVIGTAMGGPVAGFIVGSLTEPMGAKVGEGLQFLHDFARSVKHINMGGNYEDTRVAYTMRQRAAQEMGSSVMNARAWLGKEAALMHQ